MKSYFFTIALSLICGLSIAQSQTTVYLKDGSKVRGAVLVNDSTGFVMVISDDNSYHYYLKNQVAQMGNDSLKSKRVRSYTLRQKGYLCNIETGATDIFLPKGGTSLLAFSFHVTNSYLVSPYASFGVGVGTDLSGSNTETFTAYVNNRLYCIKSDLSPFFDINLGYLLYASRGYSGDLFPASAISNGLIFNPCFGIRIATGKKVALTASIGYKFHYFRNSKHFDTSDAPFIEDRDETHSKGHALTFKAGFQF